MEIYKGTAEGYRQLYPSLKEFAPFLFEYGQCLAKTRQHPESIIILSEGARRSADPMFYNIIGRNEQALGNCEAAEAAFLRAYRTVPHRLYPLYLLAELYVSTGQYGKAAIIIRKALEQKPKIMSPAIEEMQHKLKNSMNRFRLNPLWAIALYLFCLACRTPEEKQLETALQFAGENRSELEKALRYYNPYSSDSLKYRAVHFLIRNMPGCWGPDSSFLQSYKHFYEEYRNLTIRYPNQYPILGQKIDSLWELKRPLLPRLEECGTPDIRHITSDYLIEETGNAFRAWEGNAYCRKCSFEEFCEYILPYRRKTV